MLVELSNLRFGPRTTTDVSPKDDNGTRPSSNKLNLLRQNFNFRVVHFCIHNQDMLDIAESRTFIKRLPSSKDGFSDRN